MTGPKPSSRTEVSQVPANEQAHFKYWLELNKVKDLDKPDTYYDYRGAFNAGINRGQDGHWPDTYKQHGHPTFSEESEYSKGPGDGGRWSGNTFIPPKKKASNTTR